MLTWFCLAHAAPPDILLPVLSGTSAPHDAAVVVSIEDYGFLPDVPHAGRDATAVATLLTATVGVPAERVRRLTSGNREQLLAAIDAAAADVGPGGRLWVWFSGHGATSPDDGSLLLIGDDAKPQPDAFVTRSLSVTELGSRVTVDTLLVVDACAAGRARDGQELLPGTRFAVPTWAASQDRLTVWTAASASELAEPYPAARHGLFTYLAVGALRGWADGAVGAPDGAVDLAEAQVWVERGMATVGAVQHPQLHGPEAVRVSGRLEPGPDLATLPLLRPGTVAADDDDTPRPPIAYLGSGLFGDSAGRSYERSEILGQLSRDAAVQKIARRHDGKLVQMAAGGGVVVVAGLGALVTAYAHYVRSTTYDLDKALYEACGAYPTSATIPSPSCTSDQPPRAPLPLAAKEAVWGGVAAAGLGIVWVGDIGRRATQRKLAAAATEAYEP